MYRKIRWLHAYTGLALVLAVIAYALSGWLIEHSKHFGEPSRDTTSRVHVETLRGAVVETHPQAARQARELRDALAVEGRIQQLERLEGGRWRAYVHTVSQDTFLTWQPGDPEVQVLIRDRNLAASLTKLHKIHGLTGSRTFQLFGLMVDVVAVAMIVFAITGIYLWWQIKRRHALGLAILGVTSSVTIAWIALLTWGP